jgi:hypothetical protein
MSAAPLTVSEYITLNYEAIDAPPPIPETVTVLALAFKLGSSLVFPIELLKNNI